MKITYKTKYNNTHQTQLSQHTFVSPGGAGTTAELAGFGTNNISGRTATTGAISTPGLPGS